MPIISLIIPVFNTEKYIHRCLGSIISQTFTDFEVILIDDGSTDSSPSICDDYASKDPRFKVFHKPNEGLPATRKFGILHSNGMYVLHVDSDDWIEPDMLENMYLKAMDTNADIVICDFYMDYTSHKVTCHNRFRDINNTKMILRDCITGEVPGYIWNRLIKAECYKYNNILFPHNLNYGEDMIQNAQLLSLPVKVSYLPLCLYHYMQNPVTMMRGKANIVISKLELKTKWIEDYLGNDYAKEIAYLKYKEKVFAFRSGIISGKDFQHIYVPFSEKLKQMKSNGLRLNICLIFVMLGYGSIANRLRRILFKTD